ncbi:hypothetical protein BH23BAC3_BH23BAC3_16360 [soil metagenome]
MLTKLILTKFFLITLLIGSVAQGQALVEAADSSPATNTTNSNDVLTSSPLINPFQFNSTFHNQNDCKSQDDMKTDFQMPVFKPDSNLTESMPILTPPPVDEKMIIPFNQKSIKPCN